MIFPQTVSTPIRQPMTIKTQAQSETLSLVGQLAPLFTLPSVQGEQVELSFYQGRRNVVLWFSRGFQCAFCREYMELFSTGYEALQKHETEVIQVAPNLLESGRIFFRNSVPAFPFVCDPDKRLFALYNLGDRGVLEASRNTVITFSHAFQAGEGVKTVYGSWVDTVNRNFLRRLHHHALTAMEQGVFIIDKMGVVRHQMVFGGLDHIPPVELILGKVQEM